MKRRLHCQTYFAIAMLLPALLAWGVRSQSQAANNRDNRNNLHEQLDRVVGVVWSEVPVRDALDRLADTQGIPIWLDRRVDPSRGVSLVAADLAIKDVLARVAKEQGLDICLFGPVVYLGPSSAAARLRTLGELRRQDARKLPLRAAERFFRKEPMRWDELATPRELLAMLAEQNRFEIASPELVVHDLWPSADLPSMALVDRLTLILAPLGLTYAVEDRGSKIRLVPIADRVVLTRRYPAGLHPEDLASRWRRLVPEASVRIEGQQIVVEAPLEGHERLRASSAKTPDEPPRTQKPAGANLDRLRIERVRFKDQPLAAVVRRLASQFHLELKWDVDELRRLGIDPDQRVSLELENVSVGELFRGMLEPVGLTFELKGSTLEIRAARR